jgi:hypothetical protein
MCGRQTSCPVPDISARCHPIRPIASALPAIEPSPGGCPARKAFPDAESSEALWHADADLLLPGQLGWQTINVSPAIELGPPRSELGSGPTYPSQDKSGQIASSPTRSAQRHNVPSLLLLSRTSAGFLGCRGLRWHVSPGRGGGRRVGLGSGVACPKSRRSGCDEPAALESESFPRCPPRPVTGVSAAWRASARSRA